MSEILLNKILDELQDVKGQIAGINDEIGGIKGQITGINEEIGGIKGELKVMNHRLDRLETKLDDYHSENITADEKLLENVQAADEKLDEFSKKTAQDLKTQAFAIEILHSEQLKIKTHVEILKSS